MNVSLSSEFNPNLLKICLFLLVIGLSFMISAEIMFEVDRIQINKISFKKIGEHVRIKGKVVDFSTNKGHSFLTLKDDTGKIKVVDFNSEKELKKIINEAEKVQIKGSVDVYQGELEIIADEISR